jgi:hypothetical protein
MRLDELRESLNDKILSIRNLCDKQKSDTIIHDWDMDLIVNEYLVGITEDLNELFAALGAPGVEPVRELEPSLYQDNR